MSLRDWLRSTFGKSARNTEPRCLACDSTELVTLAEAAYRCSSCGHEGGEGLPAYLAARKRSQIAAMSPAQRTAMVRKHLAAIGNLLAGLESLGRPGIDAADVAAAVVNAAVTTAFVVGGRMGGKEKEEEQARALAAAYRALTESEQLLDEVATALATALQIPPTQRMRYVPVKLEGSRSGDKLLEIADLQRAEFDRLERLAHALA